MEKEKHLNSILLRSGFILFSFLLLFGAQKVFAATIYLSPSSGNYSVGQTFNVSVLVNTQGTAVNTAEAQITFSSDTLDLLSVSQGSTFNLISPGSPSKGASSAYFAGGLPNPGYTGSGGSLGSMTFRAKAEGTATVSINSGRTLLNDGNGTDAYSGGSNSRFTISSAAPTPTPQPTPAPSNGTETGAVIVSSSSHPKASNWYSKSDVSLFWNRPSNAFGFSFSLDQNPNTVPDNTLDTTVTTTKSYSDLKDGIWYFHIKPRPQAPSSAFGPTTHFKIQIDTQAPKPFDIKFADQALSFVPTDTPSGIDHYELWLDDKLIDSHATSPYSLSNIDSGTHTVKVTAFDMAGNTQEASLPIEVAKGVKVGFWRQTFNVPVWLIIFMNLIILILLLIILVLLYLLLREKRKEERPIVRRSRKGGLPRE